MSDKVMLIEVDVHDTQPPNAGYVVQNLDNRRRYSGGTAMKPEWPFNIATNIQRDMEQKFPNMQLRCKECGNIKRNDWGYLSKGWPQCCGHTMTLEKDQQ